MASEDRALGRGLEDVSHLFLSGAGNPQAYQRVDDGVAQTPAGEPGARRGVAVLRPGAPLSTRQLTATLVECQDALEPGLRALESDVPCGAFGGIDVLALDRANRLTIVDVDTAPGDQLLLRGLGHVDWAARNAATLQRMFPALAIEAAPQFRLVLVAPAFSRLTRSALAQLKPAVTCFICHAVWISDRTGIFFEPLRSENDIGLTLESQVS
jgi:hypothetical protein